MHSNSISIHIQQVNLIIYRNNVPTQIVTTLYNPSSNKLMYLDSILAYVKEVKSQCLKRLCTHIDYESILKSMQSVSICKCMDTT
jgi:hypothetical protein